MPFIKRKICEKAKTKKDTLPVDWENGERKQRLLALLPDISPQETAYGKWLVTHTLERPWAELTFVERAQWAEFYFDLEKKGLRYEDHGNDDNEDESKEMLPWADYKIMYKKILVPENKKQKKKEQKRVQIFNEDGVFIGWYSLRTGEKLPGNLKHPLGVEKEKQKVKKVGAGEMVIDPKLKEMGASVPKKPQPQPTYNQFPGSYAPAQQSFPQQPTYNQFPSSYAPAQQSFPQQPIFPASQPANSQFKEITMEAARKLEKFAEASSGPYQSPYAAHRYASLGGPKQGEVKKFIFPPAL